MEGDIQLGEEGGPSPPLDHGAQKARSVLSHRGSLGKRRKPSRESIHTFLTSVSWNGTTDDVTSDRVANGRHVTKTIVNLGAPKSTKIQMNEPETSPGIKPAQHTPRVTTVHIKGTTVSSGDPKKQPSPVAHRFIVDVETKKHLLHRRDPSLDSGCSLDLSCSDHAQDSASSGKGSPDPGLARLHSPHLAGDETLSPPAEFADSPTLPRHKEQEKVESSLGKGTLLARADNQKHSQLERASSLGPPSPGIRVNFRVHPRAEEESVPTSKPPFSAPPASSSSAVVRSESLRVGDLKTWEHRRPPKLDPERRCRSLSRATGLASENQSEQPEWMHIARQKQKAPVDWENLETHMKEPHSISCTNLCESHMRDRVTVPSPGQKVALTRSVSALYPRIKMSRFERRMRRENRNPSPERKLSDDFNVVSDSTQSSGTTSSSTEDDKPSFLNVQLRHVEKTPPLNVIFQTSRPGEDASPTLPRKYLKSPFGEEAERSGQLRPQRKREPSSGEDDGSVKKETAEIKQRAKDKVLMHSQFLQPKLVEVIDGQREGAKSANDVTTTRPPTSLKRSASVQMRPKLREPEFSRKLLPRLRPGVQASTEDVPSWVQEAQRKRNSGIDWDRLDKCLSEASKRDGVSMSTECLHKPITTMPEAPAWLREIQKRKEENTRHRSHTHADEPSRDENTIPKLAETDPPLQNGCKTDTERLSTRESLTIETTTVVPSKEETGENNILKNLHPSTNKALSEPPDNAPRIVDVQPKEPMKGDMMSTVKSCSQFLDEIFSEAEGTEDEQPTEVCYVPDALTPSGESEDSPDSEKRTKKQAFMTELKSVLKKRLPPQAVDGLGSSGSITSDKSITSAQVCRKQHDQEGVSKHVQNGHHLLEDTFIQPGEIRAFSFPPPPPVLPLDFTNVTQELKARCPTAPLVNTTKHPRRDSETQTPDNSTLVQPGAVNGHASCASPIFFNHNHLLNSNRSLIPDSASQLLILHSTGILQPSQPVAVYTMPICHPVFPQALSETTSLLHKCSSTHSETTELGIAPKESSSSTRNESSSVETVHTSPGSSFDAEVNSKNVYAKDSANPDQPEIVSRGVDTESQVHSSESCSTAGQASSLLRRQEHAVSSILDAIEPYIKGDDMSDMNSVMSGGRQVPLKQEFLSKRNSVDGRQWADSVNSLASVESGVVSGVPINETLESSVETIEQKPNDFRDPPCEEPVQCQDSPDAEDACKSKGVILVSSTSTIPRPHPTTFKDLKEAATTSEECSTVTTGPDGTVRGHFKHEQSVEGSIRNRRELCNLFSRPKSHSVPNLLDATDVLRPRRKPTVSASTQTPNGLISVERPSIISDDVGNTRGVQTDSGSKLKVKRSSRDVELVTKVDSSGPLKTTRKKVTTKIVRGSNRKTGEVREVVEECYDQSSVIIRPLTAASKGVTRCVRETSDGRKYLSTVVTDASHAKRGLRKDKDREGRVIMV